MEKRILLSCGKFMSTVDIARKLHRMGHEIYVVDTNRWHFCSFSNAVAKCDVMPSPRFHSEEAIQTLVDLIEKHQIECFIPTCEEGLYVAQYIHHFPPTCEIFCSSFETMHQMHSKWLFYQRLRELGIPAPRSQLVSTQEELQQITLSTPYILKACYSRGSQTFYRVDTPDQLPRIEIERHNPWLAQEWIDGKKYSTYSICRDGVVHAHLTYPVAFGIDGNFSLYYESIDHPGILKWVQHFIAEQRFTGQIGVDFIESTSGQLYAIESNPRSTLGLQLLTQEQMADAFLGSPTTPHIAPIGSTCQSAAGMALMGWRSKPFSRYLKTFLTTKDPIFDKRDIKPFLAVPFLLVNILLTAIRHRRGLIASHTYDTEWNGESLMEQHAKRYASGS